MPEETVAPPADAVPLSTSTEAVEVAEPELGDVEAGAGLAAEAEAETGAAPAAPPDASAPGASAPASSAGPAGARTGVRTAILTCAFDSQLKWALAVRGALEARDVSCRILVPTDIRTAISEEQ